MLFWSLWNLSHYPWDSMQAFSVTLFNFSKTEFSKLTFNISSTYAISSTLSKLSNPSFSKLDSNLISL